MQDCYEDECLGAFQAGNDWNDEMGDVGAQSNQFEINFLLEDVEEPASPRAEECKGNISFDDMNHSFN